MNSGSPGYLFDTDGGWQALRVIAGVDIILGPVLTLIAANPKKSTRELRKDFTAIGIIQVCALSAGTWLAWDNRPYAVLWYDGMAYSLPWSALRGEDSALAGLKRIGDTHLPQRVFVDLPLDPFARGEIVRTAALHGSMPLLNGDLYRQWPPTPALAKAFSQLAINMDSDDGAALQKDLEARRVQNPAAVLVPVRSRYASYYLVMDADSGTVLDTVQRVPDKQLISGFYSPRRLQALLDAQAAPAPAAAPTTPPATAAPAGQ